MSARAPVTRHTSHWRRLAAFDLTLLVACAVGLLIVTYRSELLPAKFSYDGDKLAGLALQRRPGVEDQSYENVAWLYRVAGIADNPLLAGLVGFGFMVLVVVAIRLRAGTLPAPSWRSAFLAGLCLVLGAVYLGYFTKDLLVLAVVLPVVLLRRQRYAEPLILAVMVAYGLVFRDYWLLVAVCYAALRVVTFWRLRLVVLLGGCACLLVALAIYLEYVADVPSDYYRWSVNEARQQSLDASSMIRPPFDIDGPLHGPLDLLGTFAFLAIPIPLALKASAYYISLAAMISVVWLTFFSTLRRPCWDVDRRTSSAVDVAFLRCICLVSAFLVVQSLFEPDYGSALRHLTPLLPAMLYAVWRTDGSSGLHADGRGRVHELADSRRG